MKIARWVEESNGNWVWVCQDCKLATISATEHGTWESQWYSAEWGSVTLGEEFHSVEDACLATEKYGPPREKLFSGWFESKVGGYMKHRNGKPVYVRKTEQGWYAVRNDGQLLGQRQRVVWFGTAEQACKAVDRVWCTPKILDLFSADNPWCWIKYEKQRSSAA
jgi:hypothetical protein